MELRIEISCSKLLLSDSCALICADGDAVFSAAVGIVLGAVFHFGTRSWSTFRNLSFSISSVTLRSTYPLDYSFFTRTATGNYNVASTRRCAVAHGCRKRAESSTLCRLCNGIRTSTRYQSRSFILTSRTPTFLSTTCRFQNRSFILTSSTSSSFHDLHVAEQIVHLHFQNVLLSFYDLHVEDQVVQLQFVNVLLPLRDLQVEVRSHSVFM